MTQPHPAGPCRSPIHSDVSALPPHLPADLAERIRDLCRDAWRYAGCPTCREVTERLETAVLCVRYDQPDVAAGFVRQAIMVADDPAHAHPDVPATASSGGRRGQVDRWRDVAPPLIAATDASWKRGGGGIAYVITDGRWGLRSRYADRLDPSGPARVLVNELRGVELLLSQVDDTELVVLSDSVGALGYLRRWQQGDTSAMPADYSLRPRFSGAPPTLVRLARRVARLPGISFRHVKSHRGHALNEAADALATMARRRITERFDITSRAHDLVDAFLRDWHATPRDQARGTAAPGAAVGSRAGSRG